MSTTMRFKFFIIKLVLNWDFKLLKNRQNKRRNTIKIDKKHDFLTNISEYADDTWLRKSYRNLYMVLIPQVF